MLRTALLAAASFGLIASAHAQHKVRTVTFELAANPAFVSCFSGGMPSATVTVRRGNLADRLLISVSGLRPNLQFDLFTVQRSSLDANGKPIPAANFPGFGLAWYQTDLEADDNGKRTRSSERFCWIKSSGLTPTSWRTARHGFPRRTPFTSASGSTTPTTPCHAASMPPSQPHSTGNIRPGRWR